MIDVIAQTPIEYSKQSRDYQVIARLYTALYNLSKMYIDDMNFWSADIDNKLSHLRAKTLNFHPKHAWEYEALDAATSCLKDLVRRKGTMPAIKECVRILERINNLSDVPDGPDVSVDYNTYTIIIKVPKQLASMGVVEDLLRLIIPIGMGYRIIEYEVIRDGVEDNFAFSDKIDVKHNVKIIPTYKMGIGGPKIEYDSEGKPHYVEDGYPSLHIAPGTMGEIKTIEETTPQDQHASIWPEDNNQSQGALIHYNLVTTMGEVRDSHGELNEYEVGGPIDGSVPDGVIGRLWKDKVGGTEDTEISPIVDNTKDKNTDKDSVKWKKKKK